MTTYDDWKLSYPPHYDREIHEYHWEERYGKNVEFSIQEDIFLIGKVVGGTDEFISIEVDGIVSDYKHSPLKGLRNVPRGLTQ